MGKQLSRQPDLAQGIDEDVVCPTGSCNSYLVGEK
jgi:hypothetical protein